MYILFLLIWIIFNGKITLEIVLLGLVIAGVMYAFICKFMEYSTQKDKYLMKKFGQIVYYIMVLIIEIVKANLITVRFILSYKYQTEPVLVTFRADLKTNMAKMVLANSITLTPGTITVSLENDEYVVHCLDKTMAVGIDNSIFIRLLRKMEEGVEQIERK